MQLPVPVSIPLYYCLSKQSRALIDSGVSSSEAKDWGALLATELIGTERYLQSIGQQFEGEPLALLYEYASRCTPQLNVACVDAIWQLAQKSQSIPSWQPKGVEAYIRAWYDTHDVKPKQPTTEQVVNSPSTFGRITNQPKNFDPEQTPNDWEAFIAEAIASDAIANPKQRLFTLKRLAVKWKVSVSFIESVVEDLHAPKSREKKTRSLSLSQFLNQATNVQEWIVPGLVYRGGLFILSGRAKVGKSLFLTDLMMAGMEGGSLGNMCSLKNQLKILVVTTDEGTNETIDKLIKRGFDDLQGCDERLRFMSVTSGISLQDLSPLESELEDFHPDLVLMDCLRSLSRHSSVTENEAEFAKPLKQLKELIERYQAGCILIHHDNKDPLKNGVDCLSGSTAIASTASGWMRLIAQNPKDERDPNRILIVGNSRGGEPFRYLLKINPDGKWIDEGCFEYLGEIGDEGTAAAKAMLERVLAYLGRHLGKCYAATELHNLLGGQLDTLFKALSKGVRMELLSRRKQAREFSLGRGRRPWLYFLPGSCDGDSEHGVSTSPNGGGHFYLPTPDGKHLVDSSSVKHCHSHTYTQTRQPSVEKLEFNAASRDTASTLTSGIISGNNCGITVIPENLPDDTLKVPQIHNSLSESHPVGSGAEIASKTRVCVNKQVNGSQPKLGNDELPQHPQVGFTNNEPQQQPMHIDQEVTNQQQSLVAHLSLKLLLKVLPAIFIFLKL